MVNNENIIVRWMHDTEKVKRKKRSGPKVIGLTTNEAALELSRLTGLWISQQMVKDWRTGRTEIPAYVRGVLG